MKFIRKLLLTLLLLALLAIMLLFMVGQTRWAAGCLSSWISDNNEYRFSVGKFRTRGSNRTKLGWRTSN